MPVSGVHFVSGASIVPPFEDGLRQAVFALGCFWGAERLFWTLDGVVATAVGYTAGFTPHPLYEEVCSGRTGHTEAVLVVYDPRRISYQELLRVFWEGHDPTQGMGQGNDRGTQYRSGVYVFDEEQRETAEASMRAYQEILSEQGYSDITTEIESAGPFSYAEEYHQQYLAKNPAGYCGLGGTGVSCPIGLGASR
jgi:peptide-methionine (S)-S-oxide reductase